MLTARVPGFAPDVNGFRFVNAFPSVPDKRVAIPGVGEVALGNAANGVCGGMVFAARDFFEFGVLPPTDTMPPAERTPLFDYIVDRLLASFDLPLGPARYYEWMALPDADEGPIAGVATRTRRAWRDVRRVLDSGKPAPLGLIRAHSTALADLGKNHQVLAYGYDLDDAIGALTLRLYDPNHPGEAVTLSCSLEAAQPLDPHYSSGEATRGFFLTRYRRSDPRFLLNEGASPRTSGWSRILSRLRTLFG